MSIYVLDMCDCELLAMMMIERIQKWQTITPDLKRISQTHYIELFLSISLALFYNTYTNTHKRNKI
jgi:hypothetical protein